ncbi:META domain-containing protein [Alteromonas sp. KUL49]|uniref:META domain-containing protein n=1 Tax=Alteromonas sp. KUL49 TaxID=2480798 RepID=UPI00102EFA60|nr:META domain-containing protein [Alteromonas sp. KUL49]TAP34502.1 META domain-containing protein [Alteromonas sp. KUL49]GEA13554.1 heat-shock protein HslJ [Alteromonas sp. KUL49]
MINVKRAAVVLCITVLVSACYSTAKAPITVTDLQHHNWQVIAIDGTPLSPDVDNRLPNIEFGENFTVNGFSGCNSFFGQGELMDNKLRVANMGQTRKMCIPNEMDTEQAITSTLVDWSHIEWSEKDITLKGKQHTLTLKLRDWVN